MSVTNVLEDFKVQHPYTYLKDEKGVTNILQMLHEKTSSFENDLVQFSCKLKKAYEQYFEGNQVGSLYSRIRHHEYLKPSEVTFFLELAVSNSVHKWGAFLYMSHLRQVDKVEAQFPYYRLLAHYTLTEKYLELYENLPEPTVKDSIKKFKESAEIFKLFYKDQIPTVAMKESVLEEAIMKICTQNSFSMPLTLNPRYVYDAIEVVATSIGFHKELLHRSIQGIMVLILCLCELLHIDYCYIGKEEPEAIPWCLVQNALLAASLTRFFNQDFSIAFQNLYTSKKENLLFYKMYTVFLATLKLAKVNNDYIGCVRENNVHPLNFALTNKVKSYLCYYHKKLAEIWTYYKHE